MNRKHLDNADYTSMKKLISSNTLTSYNVVNLFAGELKKILLEEHTQFKIKKLTTFEKDVVRWYVNMYIKDADLSNETDIDIIKKIQDIREDIFHTTRVAEDTILNQYIRSISKSKNKQYITSALRSLEEKYRDTESIERKLFLREQAKKCISSLPAYQESFRKQKFDYKNIIEPIILKP